MNKNIEKYKNGALTDAYGMWNLTYEQLTKAIEVLSKYFEVEKPINEAMCIYIKNEETYKVMLEEENEKVEEVEEVDLDVNGEKWHLTVTRCE